MFWPQMSERQIYAATALMVIGAVVTVVAAIGLAAAVVYGAVCFWFF